MLFNKCVLNNHFNYQINLKNPTLIYMTSFNFVIIQKYRYKNIVTQDYVATNNQYIDIRPNNLLGSEEKKIKSF